MWTEWFRLTKQAGTFGFSQHRNLGDATKLIYTWYKHMQKAHILGIVLYFFVYKYVVTPDFFCVKLLFDLPFQVHPKDVNKFQQAYCSLLKGNLDGLKKLKKTKTKAKATQ